MVVHKSTLRRLTTAEQQHFCARCIATAYSLPVGLEEAHSQSKILSIM